MKLGSQIMLAFFEFFTGLRPLLNSGLSGILGQQSVLYLD
jgi:hypothetical protein